MSPHDKQTLVSLLAKKSAQRGSFVLASGKQSSLYIDARLTTMSPEGLTLIGPLGLAAMRDAGWMPDSVGGLTLGADPIGSTSEEFAAFRKTELARLKVLVAKAGIKSEF